MKLNPHRLAKRTLVSSVAFILAGGAALALNPDEWRHSQPVTVGQTGLVRVNLPASTLDAAQPDFSDLRVLDPGGSEVSFLVERPMPKPESVSQFFSPAQFMMLT